MSGAGARKIPDPPGYGLQREILAGLSEAQRRWERETGARLVGFRYTRDHLPPPSFARTGETVSEKPVRDQAGRVVARRLIREHPDGTTTATLYPLEWPKEAAS